MMHFIVALRIFYALSTISVLATGILLISYQRERQNLLLRSCCLVLFCIYAVILIGHARHEELFSNDNPFCEAQAIFLNYCYICMHAHASFMMFNNCYVALGWRFRIFERFIDRESTLVILSYAIPLIYLVILTLLMTVGAATYRIIIRPGPFFCNLIRPRFILSTVWFILLAVPGSVLAIYLLYKSIRARMRTVAFGTASQLSKSYIFRLSLSTLIYITLGYGSFVPLLLISNPDLFQSPSSSPVIVSPWIRPDVCTDRSGFELVKYYAWSLCPGILSFFPAVLGIALFLMYGFGTHARLAYKQFFGCCLGGGGGGAGGEGREGSTDEPNRALDGQVSYRGSSGDDDDGGGGWRWMKRRNSTMPLMMSEQNPKDPSAIDARNSMIAKRFSISTIDEAPMVHGQKKEANNNHNHFEQQQTLKSGRTADYLETSEECVEFGSIAESAMNDSDALGTSPTNTNPDARIGMAPVFTPHRLQSIREDIPTRPMEAGKDNQIQVQETEDEHDIEAINREHRHHFGNSGSMRRSV